MTDWQEVEDRHWGLMRGVEDARRGEYNEGYELVAPLAFLEGYHSGWDLVRPGWDSEGFDR